MSKKTPDNGKIIHIHATCDQFEIFEHQPENKAEPRLRAIRDLYMKVCTKAGTKKVFGMGKNKRKQFVRNDTNKLVVNTFLVNPTLL